MLVNILESLNFRFRLPFLSFYPKPLWFCHYNLALNIFFFFFNLFYLFEHFFIYFVDNTCFNLQRHVSDLVGYLLSYFLLYPGDHIRDDFEMLIDSWFFLRLDFSSAKLRVGMSFNLLKIHGLITRFLQSLVLPFFSLNDILYQILKRTAILTINLLWSPSIVLSFYIFND